MKKGAWNWTKDSTTAFEQLKEALCSAPVLVLLDFTLELYVDTDASGFGIGVVLQQQGRSMAYFSRRLGIKHQAFSIFEKELLDVLLAIKKWHSYLVGRHFKIRTDHQSLRFLANQVVVTPFQQK